ncbi:EF-hand domain-containing protein [Pseudonocardiaceae bacterium YIM PH 21723]|nr:EF-hand domain-containing protein [Pseudonocardiaceae bacterium YIM PH 21723]
MLTQVQIDNIDRVFAVLDLDGNNEITWDDFETVTAGQAKEAGLTVDAPEAQALLAAYRKVWDYVREVADTDNSGGVVKSEFRAGYSTQRLSGPELLDLWAEVANRCFELADRDGDGHLTAEEFGAIYRGAGIADPEVAETAFAEADTDSDHRLDKDEFVANVRGIFTATEDAMKGSRMLRGR